MSGFIEGEDRTQATLFLDRIDDYVGEDSPVRVVDVFIDELKISAKLRTSISLTWASFLPIHRYRCVFPQKGLTARF